MTPATVLRVGDRGRDVRVLQEALNHYYAFGLAADGVFGARTKAAVRTFQYRRPPLAVDGVVGPVTWAAVLKPTPPVKGWKRIRNRHRHGADVKRRRDAATADVIDKTFGTRHGAVIVAAAERELLGVVPHPVALAAAVAQTETNGRNIYGHDPTIFVGAGPVTKENYLRYRGARGPHGEGGMQGVGVPQLTFWSLQDEADAEGGCWDVGAQMTVACRELARLIRSYGLAGGVARYNGSGATAARYSVLVLARSAWWLVRFRAATRRIR